MVESCYIENNMPNLADILITIKHAVYNKIVGCELLRVLKV
jgi:hypothetical protein